MNHLYDHPQFIQLFLRLACLISIVGGTLPVLAQEPEPTTPVKEAQLVAQKFDEYGDIRFDDEKARLDNFAIELQSAPTSQGFILAYGRCAGQGIARAERAKYYLVHLRGIDSARVVTVDGDCMSDLRLELWIVPIGATAPVANTENAISPCPECRGRVRRARGRRSNRGSTSSFWDDIPEFPWPPPLASAVATVPRSLVTNAGNRTLLKDVAARLEGAFYQAGYGDKSWYRVPDGFAMVSRLEQFKSDGTPLQGNARFSVNPARPDTSLMGLLKDLFLAREGHYRVIAFLVTARPIHQAPRRLSRSGAASLVSEGADRLSENIGEQPFTESHHCTAYIYEFLQRTPDHPAEFVSSGTLDGKTHLQRSGILGALERRRQ